MNYQKQCASGEARRRRTRSRSTATVHVPAEPVRRVGALDDRRQLRVADARLFARCAHAARADADLDNIGARQDQLCNEKVCVCVCVCVISETGDFNIQQSRARISSTNAPLQSSRPSQHCPQ